MASGDHLTYVGHATVLIELDGVRVLTDPVLRNRVAHLRRHSAPPAPDITRAIDAVLLSHQHLDHLDVPSLRRLAKDIPVFTPPGAGRRLARAGYDQVSELAPGAVAHVAGLSVRATEAVHDGRRWPLGATRPAIGFEISGSRRIYFAGDTARFPGMADLAGGLDIALLPVWGWGPTLGPGHLDPAEAAQAAALLQPRLAIPIHWGTFAPIGPWRWGASRLRGPAGEFAAQCASLTPGVTVAVLEPGSSLALS